MKKETKHLLRTLVQEVAGLNMCLSRPASEVAKNLDKAVSLAWEEGQEEKKRVDREVAAVERKDEEAIKNAAHEMADKWKAEATAEFKQLVEQINRRAEDDANEVTAYLNKLSNVMQEMSDWDRTKKSVHIIPFGDYEPSSMFSAAHRALWDVISGDNEGEDRKYGDYWTVIIYQTNSDETFTFYVCVYSEDEYRKYKQTKALSRSELKRVLKHLPNMMG